MIVEHDEELDEREAGLCGAGAARGRRRRGKRTWPVQRASSVMLRRALMMETIKRADDKAHDDDRDRADRPHQPVEADTELMLVELRRVRGDRREVAGLVARPGACGSRAAAGGRSRQSASAKRRPFLTSSCRAVDRGDVPRSETTSRRILSAVGKPTPCSIRRPSMPMIWAVLRSRIGPATPGSAASAATMRTRRSRLLSDEPDARAPRSGTRRGRGSRFSWNHPDSVSTIAAPAFSRPPNP